MLVRYVLFLVRVQRLVHAGVFYFNLAQKENVCVFCNYWNIDGATPAMLLNLSSGKGMKCSWQSMFVYGKIKYWLSNDAKNCALFWPTCQFYLFSHNVIFSYSHVYYKFNRGLAVRDYSLSRVDLISKGYAYQEAGRGWISAVESMRKDIAAITSCASCIRSVSSWYVFGYRMGLRSAIGSPHKYRNSTCALSMWDMQSFTNIWR